MSTQKKKVKPSLWGCLVCKCLKNSIHLKKCQICGAKRAVDRFGFSHNDVYYLCHVNTARAFPQVTITRLSTPESTVTVKLPMIQESLLDAVIEAVSNVASKNVNPGGQSITESNQTISDDLLKEEQQPEEGKRLDLYHRVMHKAQDVEYDVIMGQFVPAGEATSTSHGGSVHHKNLNYVQSMKKQKDVMDKIVKDTILSRVAQAESPSKDINTTADNLNEWKAKAPCALCGYLYPPAQLLGSISNHSILNWLKEHNAYTDSKECKKLSLQEYEAAKMCLFCTQFFDENYTDTFDVEQSANEDIRNRRKAAKKKTKKESKEDKVIAKLNEKLSIAELKSKKVNSRKHFHGMSKDEEERNAEIIAKLEHDKRKMKFEEAKEKFNRHKANLAKNRKAAAGRAQSANSENLPSLNNKNNNPNSKEGNITSRSAGSNAKKSMKESSSDTKIARVKNKREKKIQTKGSLPSIISEKKTPGAVMKAVEEGDVDSIASIEASIDSIDEALQANNSDSPISSSPTKKKKKKKKKKKEVIHRMTKKEISRLELLKEIATKKEKEASRYKSRKLNREKDWSDVRVGDGGEAEDKQIFRDKEKRAAMLIEEYEREMSRHQASRTKNEPDTRIDRPDWDSTTVQRISGQPTGLPGHVSEEYSDDDDEDVIEAKDEVEDKREDNTQHSSGIPYLKPTISLEMIQQHKQHLQAMHLKHLETHIDHKNSVEQSRPLTKDAPVRTSITKNMLEKHKKHVISSTKDKNIVVSYKPVRKNIPRQNSNTHRKSNPKAHSDLSNDIPLNFNPHIDPREVLNEDRDDSDYGDDDDFNDEDEADEVEEDEHVKKKDDDDEEEVADVDDDDDVIKGKEEEEEEETDVVNDVDVMDVESQVLDDDDVDTPAMIDFDCSPPKKVTKEKNDVNSSSLAPKVSPIVCKDANALKGPYSNDFEDEDEKYDGFDSLLDSLQNKAAKVQHTSIALLEHDEACPLEPKIKIPPVVVDDDNANVLASQDTEDVVEEHVDEVVEVKAVINCKKHEVEEEEEICEISFDDEDDTPYDDDLYSNALLRCSPVNTNKETEDQTESRLHSAASTPSKGSRKKGIEMLRSGASRGGSRRGGARSNRLDQFENVRPTSNSRTLRPISRSSITSSGSVRKGKSSQSSRLDQYDNSGTTTPGKLKGNELDSLGQFSLSGISSPPLSAAAMKRRKRSNAGVNKLEVMGSDGPGLFSPDAAARRKSMGSRSSLKTPVKSVNTLSVVTPTESNGGTRKNSILPSNLEHRIQTHTTETPTKTNNSGSSATVNVDSKIHQQERRNSRLPHREESFSKISKKIDETPSMLDLSIMKFNGEVQMKRMDSFEKLTKKIIIQQQQQHQQQQQSLSPTKRSNIKRHTIVNGGAIYS